MNRLAWLASAGLAVAAAACGARSSLHDLDRHRGAGGAGGGGGGGVGGSAGAGGQGGTGGQGGAGGSCDVEGLPCTTNLPGPCAAGFLHCLPEQIQCLPKKPPTMEQCNLVDDDCNGAIDNGDPGGGGPCNTGLPSICAAGTLHCDNGKLQCFQNVPPQPEICNGIDDNCNNVIDQDCVKGDCQPKLLVLGSQPSSPTCQDFPITKGTTGTIKYPCAGGMVSATLAGVLMSGSVTNGVVSLTGTNSVTGPDKCTWQLTHTIKGTLASGVLAYGYSEKVTGGNNCWNPCTETGTVAVQWQ